MTTTSQQTVRPPAQPDGEPAQVLIINGSTRPGSYTRALADAARMAVEATGQRALLWDLGERPLPIADPLYHHDPAANPDMAARELVLAARESAGFLLASPIYHSSFSGVLKNALDNLSMIEFRGKPVGLLAHGSQLSAVQVCDQLRIVMRSLYALTVPEQVVTVPADYRPGPVLASQNGVTRLAGVVRAVTALTTRHA